MTNVLVLHANGEDYLGDSLLHGLRTVLGADCVDAPRRDALYDDISDEGAPRALRPRLHALRPPARGRHRPAVAAAPRARGRVRRRRHHRHPPQLGAVAAAAPTPQDDARERHRPRGLRRRRRPGALPARPDVVEADAALAAAARGGPRARLQARAEPHDRVVRYYGLLPPGIAERRLASTSSRSPSRSPKSTSPPATSARPAARRAGRRPRGARPARPRRRRLPLRREADYHADLRASRFGVTTKKAGWDALRHYEVAAAGAVPCVRDLHLKPERSAPFGLHDGINCVAYPTPASSWIGSSRCRAAEVARLRAGALEWAARNTTRPARASCCRASAHDRPPAPRRPGHRGGRRQGDPRRRAAHRRLLRARCS